MSAIPPSSNPTARQRPGTVFRASAQADTGADAEADEQDAAAGEWARAVVVTSCRRSLVTLPRVRTGDGASTTIALNSTSSIILPSPLTTRFSHVIPFKISSGLGHTPASGQHSSATGGLPGCTPWLSSWLCSNLGVLLPGRAVRLMDWRSVGNDTSHNAPVNRFHIVPLQLHVSNAQRRRLSSLLPPGGVPLVRGPRPGAREIDVDAAVDVIAIIITAPSISVENAIVLHRPTTSIATWLIKSPPLAIAIAFAHALNIAAVAALVPAAILSAFVIVGIVPFIGAIVTTDVPLDIANVTAASIGHPPFITTATQFIGIISSV